MDLSEPSPQIRGLTHRHRKRRAPPGPGSKWKPSTGFIVAIVLVGLVGLGAIINAFDGESNGGSSSSGGSDALTERTCDIARDISQDAADGVDTTFETRDRFKDLLDGYGESAPADIAVPLRETVAALTSLDNAALSSAVGRLDSACSSRGF